MNLKEFYETDLDFFKILNDLPTNQAIIKIDFHEAMGSQCQLLFKFYRKESLRLLIDQIKSKVENLNEKIN